MNIFKRQPKFIKLGSSIYKFDEIKDARVIIIVGEKDKWYLKIDYLGVWTTKEYDTEQEAIKALEFIWDYIKDLQA